MARAPALGNLGLNPFGGAGVSFSAFDIGSTDNESRLILTRVATRWRDGLATDTEYEAALDAFGKTLGENTTERLNNDSELRTLRYSLAREKLVKQVEDGVKEMSDLVAYDRQSLTGLNAGSQEWRQRKNALETSQSRYLADLEDDVVKRYQDGRMTTAQLRSWYGNRIKDPAFSDNHELVESVRKRITELDGRLIDERDSKIIDDFQNGKVTPQKFIAYATSARARYAPGTTSYREWTDRLNQANDHAREQPLLYRYDLSQQYAQLAKFVASNSKGLGGRTSTSHTTRTVLGADGRWKTVTTSSTHAVKPSAAEVQAYHKRQIEVADAKRQMGELSRKLGRVGGGVTTGEMLTYYNRQLGRFARGSSDWYQVQQKIDQLNDRRHAETVLAREGIRISYPRSSTGGSSGGGGGGGGSRSSGVSGSSPSPSPDRGVTLSAFMRAIAHVESGGRYTAVNKSSGARGKYQIMPSNWPGWAHKYLGDANAPWTPANQEKVAEGKFKALYRWLGDWRAVAHWWLTGGADKNRHKNPATWSASSRHYVDNVMAGLGRPATSTLQASGSYTPAGGGSSSGGGGGYSAPAGGGGGSTAAAGGAYAPSKAGPGVTSRHATPPANSRGPLKVVTGVSRAHRTGEQLVSSRQTGFPTGLDAEAFAKFYSQYRQAYESGLESFSVNTPKGEVHYFIGDDAGERLEGMRELDKLRVGMYAEKMRAHAGTPSEITAANQYDNAIEDAGANELLALRTSDQQFVGQPAAKSPNPIARGLDVVEKTVAGIDAHMTLAQEAFKRGDLTAAYAHLQAAAALRASKEAVIGQYVASAKGRIAAIEKQFGTSRGEALGKGGAEAFQKDLDALLTSDQELEKALGKGTELLGEIRQVAATDRNGDLIFDSSGPGGQLLLRDGYDYHLSKDGSIEVIPLQASGVDNTGAPQVDRSKYVKVDVRVGNNTVAALTEFTVAQVGWIVTPTGQQVPIQGKVAQYRDPVTRQLVQSFENPFAPGHWSTSAIIYHAPASFASVAAVKGAGGSVLQFTIPQAGPMGRTVTDGFTYTLELDPKTGTYILSRSKPAGLFSAEVNEVLGPMSEAQAADLFRNAGFARDSNGLSGDALYFADTTNPIFNFTADQHRSWKRSQQSPVQPYMVPGGLGSLSPRGGLGSLGRGRPTPVEATRTGEDRGTIIPRDIKAPVVRTPVAATRTGEDRGTIIPGTDALTNMTSPERAALPPSQIRPLPTRTGEDRGTIIPGSPASPVRKPLPRSRPRPAPTPPIRRNVLKAEAEGPSRTRETLQRETANQVAAARRRTPAPKIRPLPRKRRALPRPAPRPTSSGQTRMLIR